MLSVSHLFVSTHSRPISPDTLWEGVVVSWDGTVKIVDFGIAKARGRLTESGLHKFKGKLGYCSPEHVLAYPLDHRSDIFALGIVAFELGGASRCVELFGYSSAFEEAGLGLRHELDRVAWQSALIEAGVPYCGYSTPPFS